MYGLEYIRILQDANIQYNHLRLVFSIVFLLFQLMVILFSSKAIHLINLLNSSK